MMADNYKILAQDTAASVEENSGEDQANILYTVPENTQAAISSISLINTAEENVEYSLGVIKAEDVDSSIQTTPPILQESEFVGPFVAVGYFQTSAISTDGITWTATTMPESTYWQSVTYGDNKFVAVSYIGGYSAYSSNGIAWSGTTLPADAYWVSVTYGDNKFVAVGYFHDSAAYSTDGIDWTQNSLPGGSQRWNSVAYGKGKFVAVATYANFVAHSTDGINWGTGEVSFQPWKQVAYGNDKFVIMATSYAAYSDDGITWTQTTLPINEMPRSIAYGNGKFVAMTNSMNSLSSTDGITWIATSLPGISSTYYAVAYGGDKFVALTSNDFVFLTSTDGITWEINSYPAEEINSSNNTFRSVVAGPTLPGFQAPGYSLNILSNAQTIIPTRSIEPNVVDEIIGGITLSEGDQIRIYSESPDLIAQVYGVEIS
jgi:hypothetical protein